MRGGRAALAAVPVVSLAVTALIAAGVLTTLSQFTASIGNPTNVAESGSVGLLENGVCPAPGDGQWHECAGINKFGGGPLASGGSRVTPVTLQNTGASAARLFVLPSRCQDTLAGAGGGLCDQVTVEVRCAGAPVVAARTLNAFHQLRDFPTGYPAATLAPGAAVTCEVALSAGSIPAAGSVSQPIAWRLAAGS